MKSSICRFIPSLAAAGLLAQTASALTLSGVIRDFNDTHPDMEKDIGGLQPA